jgi:hypothetical protein
MRVYDIAKKIRAHLQRFEADPIINAENKPGGLTPYFHANAWDAGRYVAVRYVSFQGTTHLSKADAERYLAWLDAGNVGKHYEVLGRV